ncbi:S-adenosylmethionine decarboxylase [Candidatus Saganbacteria bacterium]|nr:S-adenosylmethionine decarboxylase [Candidatus Saganbacteria bacterium]
MVTGKIDQNLGLHMIIDCYDCDEAKLSDPAMITESLDVFSEKIGNKKLMPPYVFKFNGNNPQEHGITGIVLLVDSHITIHTFPGKKHAFVDIFSSRDFDTDHAVSFMTTLFSAKAHDEKILRN